MPPNSHESWESRSRDVKPVFEFFQYVITTVTWLSFSVVVSVLIVRGYWTPSPALTGMGAFGTGLYIATIVVFIIIAALSSLALVAALWKILLSVKWEIEFGPNPWAAFFTGWLGNWFLFGVAMFLMIAVAAVSIPLLQSAGVPPPNQVSQPGPIRTAPPHQPEPTASRP